MTVHILRINIPDASARRRESKSAPPPSTQKKATGSRTVAFFINPDME